MKLGGILATALVALCATSLGCGDDSSPAPVESVPALGFVERFAPLVHLHANERAWPMSVGTFLYNSRLKWAGADGASVPIATGPGRLGRDPEKVPIMDARRLGDDAVQPYLYKPPGHQGCLPCPVEGYAANSYTRPFGSGDRKPGLRSSEGYYLDLLTDWLPGRRRVEHDGTQVVLRDTPVYTEVVEEERRDTGLDLRVTYWMLFGLNQPPTAGDADPLAHEGDWERISVLLRRADGGTRYEPVSVRFHQDDDVRDVDWDDVEVGEDGPGEPLASHPVVYLSRGSHTPHPEPVDEQVDVPFAGDRFKVRDEAQSCERCPQWRTWRQVVNADTQPWWGFGGAWGNAWLNEASTGPLGPSFHIERQ